MSDNIVKRLREEAEIPDDIYVEAADEIERLRAELAAYRERAERAEGFEHGFNLRRNELIAERDAARTELAAARAVKDAYRKMLDEVLHHHISLGLRRRIEKALEEV